MKVVLDTNVLLAGYMSKGICAEILDWCVLSRELVLSAFILDELKTKLVTKFHFPESQAQRLVKELKKEVIFVVPEETKVAHLRDPKDKAIINTAIAADAKIIISGDKDLLVLKQYHGIKILTPRQFFDTFLN